jgi:TetR/AcrR family transcriptional regulator, transcriptional repressor for nem operon
MARPIQFDEARAVDRALMLFWRKGYQAASLADLLGAMGIGRSSFYAAFGSKRRLFIRCLDLFAERLSAMLVAAGGDVPPLDALQGFFERSGSSSRGARAQWGCLLVNSVLELAGVDDGLAAHASAHLAAMERHFRACLAASGAAPARAEALASVLMLVNEGLRVSSRRNPPGAPHRQPIATIFRLIRSELA